MVDQANIVKVIIASPADLKDEREVIPGLFNRWNHANSEVHLEPVMWESSSVPAMGDHPQHILNEQIIKDGDLLVALFWSKIGTPTPTSKSGTVEEIREFINKKGSFRVMVYFCNRPIQRDPSNLNVEEIKTLQEFRIEMKSKCLFQEFGNTDELEKHLYHHLDIKVKQLLNGELPVPGIKTNNLSEDSWYRIDHPDARLRQPINFGNTLIDIANGFSKRMDEFEWIKGGTNDKFLDLGSHVYMSVAQSIEHALLLKPYDVPFEAHTLFKDISQRLKNLSASRKVEQFSEFWEQGRKISNELNKIIQKVCSPSDK